MNSNPNNFFLQGNDPNFTNSPNQSLPQPFFPDNTKTFKKLVVKKNGNAVQIDLVLEQIDSTQFKISTNDKNAFSTFLQKLEEQVSGVTATGMQRTLNSIVFYNSVKEDIDKLISSFLETKTDTEGTTVSTSKTTKITGAPILLQPTKSTKNTMPPITSEKKL